MSTQLQPLNEAQALIYSRNNISRTYEDFDPSDIAGLFRSDSDLIVTRTDGSQQAFPAAPIKESFKEFTGRLPNFFEYLGPNFRGPSIWRNNCYILFKGWHYQAQGSALSMPAKAQSRWADKLAASSIYSEDGMVALLEEFQLGYLVSPDGKTAPPATRGIPNSEAELVEQEQPKPFCSCGSFQRQVNLIDDIRQEIPGYEPTCKHMTWFAKYREFLAKRNQLLASYPSGNAEKATAWFYAPPNYNQKHGRLAIIFTNHGQNAPIEKWRWYKSSEQFNETHLWGLLDSMIENGYVPFPHTGLLQTANAFKSK